ncbi:hypothetical protein LMG10661_01018 [Ralstonia syzygii subsp. syzygii]|nr:hypothetical protein LMG10661_01018 [Ralstonia syzygii subsp. syzygii]
MPAIATLQRANHGSHFRAYGLRGVAALIDPCLGIDHAWMSAPTFAPHPHAGFSAVSYLFLDFQAPPRQRQGHAFWRPAAARQRNQPLLTLVPLDTVHVEANFRETQLARVRVGQPVAITVDALPNIRLQGRGESLGPASGISFSTTPPHNATGNVTKIVQRLPVRIRLEPGQEAARQLRVGMSVRPRIDVSTGRPEIARAGRDTAGNAASATPRPPRT